MNLAKALVERGHEVTIWSTDFYHQEKRHRFGEDRCIKVSSKYTVRLVSSIGYRRHVGLRRFADHAQLGWRFPALARKCAIPDVAFIGLPPLEIAAAAVRFCASLAVPCVVDVKDLWPDIFEETVPAIVRPIARLALSPLRASARAAMRGASGLCATTEDYLAWALRHAGRERSIQDCVAPILPPTERVAPADWSAACRAWEDLGVPDDGRLRACFVGNLGRTTDFSPVFEAIRTDPRCGEWQFVIAGSGDQETRWRQLAANLPNVLFPGRIALPAIATLFGRSTVGLAPFIKIANYEKNVPNKVHDYLSAGLPVLTPLGGPTGALLDELGANGRYVADSPRSFADRLKAIAVSRPDRRKVMSMHSDRFNASAVAGRLVDHLERLATARGNKPWAAGKA